MAGKISPLLDPSRILLHLQSTERTAALREVAQLLVGHPAMADFDGFYAELLARDRLDTTCLGHAIAIPHARTAAVKSIVLAIGRSDAGIHFENNGEPVRLLFMLGTPKSQPGDYLLVVSALCRLLKEPAQRAALFAAATPADFIRAVAAAEDKLSASA